MELLEAEDLSFQYATAQSECLKEISFQLKKGEFVLLFGETGCGKSTLLKQWKPSICPSGKRSGNVRFEGESVQKIKQREEASYIGYVSQNPDNQIVTDKVWHELAFTLKNLGYKEQEIRKRVAEIAVFFGISSWFHKSIKELSGGQKQILNLASVMIAKPKLLLLDEPTSQLDPIATENFMNLLGRIHSEMGITILLTEHRLEQAYAKADRCMVLEHGRLICLDTVEATAEYLYRERKNAFSLLPLQARLPILLKENCSIRTIGEAKHFLEANCTGGKLEWKEEEKQKGECLVSLKNIWFRYDKNGEDVLRDFSLNIYQNDFLAIVGANGQGKSTFLQITAGILKAYKGKIVLAGQGRKRKEQTVKLALLPQNPQSLFLKSTVREDLRSIAYEIDWVVERLHLEDLLDKHPYDLSGGQQQMVAFAKVLLTKPNLLLLDEPTKGVDMLKKKELGKLLKELNQEGMTIVLVSHDVDFCAAYAKTVGMLFDGVITSMGERHEFFMDQYFYTTTCLKICREVYEGMVVEEEVLQYEQISPT